MPTKTDENGKWTVKVPDGTTLKPGDDVKARDGVGNESKEKVASTPASASPPRSASVCRLSRCCRLSGYPVGDPRSV
ncbi:hypothetical protein [Corynebacterium coyleae]|uniref:hypothetical protein n=1 Tax=Corynebacterium coyleae TaxID=53374 RepID=UPI00115F7BCA|nr:hypothetical protein [Corynebacterium coyleae]